MMPHEQALCAIYFCLAAFQLVFMSARPGSYILYRQHIACVNRMLRLLVVLLSAVLLTPAHARRQVEGVVALALRQDTHALTNTSALLQFSQAAGGTGASSGCPAHGACADGIASAAAAAQTQHSTLALLKSLLVLPAIFLGHSNFVCSFRLTLFLQVLTAAAAVRMGMVIEYLCMVAERR